MKYYSHGDGELVYDLKQFKEWLSDDDLIEPVILHEMKREIGGEMWCNEHKEFGLDCGRDYCEEYSPCNGKSGRCRHLKNGFIETYRMFSLTKDGALVEVNDDG